MLREILTAVVLYLMIASSPSEKLLPNQAPVATADTYTVHGLMLPLSPPVTANDFDPDGDPIFVKEVVVTTQHGGLSRLTGNDFAYAPAPGYVGPDTFTYRLCDNNGACSDATVSLNVVNEPPTAVNDSYVVHGITTIGPLMANDSDPDGDALIFSGPVTFPSHGTISGLTGPGVFAYGPHLGFVGDDEFTYRVCDQYQLCSVATVTLNVSNEPPVVVGESFTVHGGTLIGPMLENDFDPEGDQIFLNLVTFPAHGSLTGHTQQDIKSYGPHHAYVGPDTFTYRVCDQYLACSEPVTVHLTVVNQAPVAGADEYEVADTMVIGPLRENDFDPEGDTLLTPSLVVAPQHGTLTGTTDPDLKTYHPNAGFVGIDSFVYQLCDHLGACSTATVTLLVRMSDGAENFGKACPNQTVGGPINVANGNMYLQQSDYHLPGPGDAISITRTYNSMSKRFGLFGRGWSTNYEVSLVLQGPDRLRFFAADGQATTFRRDGSGVFMPVEGDFHGRIIQDAEGVYTLSFEVGGSYLFSVAGKLLKQIDRHENQTALVYDGDDRLTSIIDPSGRTLTLSLTGAGRVQSLTDALGQIASYDYGANNELLAVTYPDGSGYRFSYTQSPVPMLSAVTDALGNILEAHSYDFQGRATAFEKHDGVERITLNYLNNAQTDVTDALGRVTRYFLDKGLGRYVVNRVEGLCGCSGGAQTKIWTHDSQMNILSHVNAANQTTTYTYDAAGNQLSITDTLGTSSKTYNQMGQVLTSTDVTGAVTTSTYDVHGNMLSYTDALNNTATFSYNTRGQLLSITDARSNVTTFVYDDFGALKETVDAAGHRTKFAYDARGRLTSSQDPLNHTTGYAYDAAGRLNRITRADGSFITLAYDLAGRRTQITDARNNSTQYAYDSAYRIIGQTDAAGSVRTMSYDAASNLVAQTDELGQTTNFEYNELGRLMKIVYPAAVSGGARLEETIAYDDLGNIVGRTDRAGRVTSFEYDEVNRLIRVTDPVLQVSRYEYDSRSNLTAFVDAANQRHDFTHDALSRVIEMNRAGRAMSFAYDETGNRTSRTDYNGITTTYTYDSLDRLTKITYPDAGTVTYGYDALSRLTNATNANGMVSFGYDSIGRVVRAGDVFGQTLDYAYDANSNRTSMSSPGRTLAAYHYDSLNRLIQITGGAGQTVNYSYDAAGRLISKSLPNDLVTSYEYDGLSRLSKQRELKGQRALADTQYTYDALDNVTRLTDSAGARNYGYDALERVVSATYQRGPNESYEYDEVGNRTASHRSSVHEYQPFNRLLRTDTSRYLYDNNGNLTTKTEGAGTTQFQWDFENRLVRVNLPWQGSVSYKYDALGRAIQRQVNGVVTSFRHDGEDVIEDRFNNHLVVTEYMNGPGIDNKISQKSLPGTFYFMQDHLGSTVGLTDQKGKIVEQIGYDSFGNSAGPILTRYGYTGREREPLTGLLYYRARWYDPQVGRFISEDPLGLAGGVNSYAYVRNNPVNRKDPFGLYEIDVHYYLTYYLAIKTGCFSNHEARLIANGNQGTDENALTAPGPGWRKSILDPFNKVVWSAGPDYAQQQRNIDYHALNQGDQLFHLRRLWGNAVARPGNLSGLGQYLHYMQDIFSHTGFTNPNHGHGLAFHSPDKTSNDVRKAQSMAAATWQALNDYSRDKKCGCQGRWTPDMWPTIINFSKLPGGSSYQDIADLPRLLEAKRRALGVPRR